MLPDLRRMSPAVHENFKAIVIDGMLADNGMASFGDLFTESEVEDIYAYIVKRATEDRALQIPTE